MEVADIETRLKNNSNIGDSNVDDLLYMATGILVTLKNVEELSEVPDTFKYQTWVYRACLELNERLGQLGVKSYSENGYSFSYGKEQLSETLVNEIKPYVRFF